MDAGIGPASKLSFNALYAEHAAKVVSMVELTETAYTVLSETNSPSQLGKGPAILLRLNDLTIDNMHNLRESSPDAYKTERSRLCRTVGNSPVTPVPSSRL